MKNLCIFCNEIILDNIFFYKENPNISSKILADLNLNNLKINTCENCKISYCPSVTENQLSNLYKKIFAGINIKKETELNKTFSGINSRFMSQVIYFMNHSKLFENIRILEIGPNQYGIVPTIRVFQKKFKYFYYDNLEIQSDHDDIIKLGNYWNPFTNKLPKIDLIWMSHSLEHIIPNHLTHIIKSFYNALSEGGKIFIEIPNDIENKNFNMPHTLFFEVEGLTKLFKDNKFKIISISNVNKKQLVQSNSIVQKEGGSKISSQIRQLIIKSLPDCFVQYIRNLNNQKYYNSNSIIHNGPYDQRPFIRLIVEK